MTANNDNNSYKQQDSQLQPERNPLEPPDAFKAVGSINSATTHTTRFKDADLTTSDPFMLIKEQEVERQRLHQLSILNQQSVSASNKQLTLKQQASLVRYNHLSYLLYALSLFSAGLLWIVPIVMNYARRGEAEQSWLATHFDWQIKTFWYSLILVYGGLFVALLGLGGLGIGIFADSSGVAIGSVLMSVVGGAMFLFSFVWYIYRIVKGWIALTDHRPVA
ncbi:DUF4870 family protein [Psychrobacter lutiphocae]|uniref:DUF4870 family protein n=1 Tax=Psychrobacter lutiphocae TaxID=540500 RepID=UPI000376B302|nr:hypothetical protein [Psychrobacter lutiphocae]